VWLPRNWIFILKCSAKALQYMRSCQINVKILTKNSSSLLFKLPCQQPTFQCPDFEDAVLRAVTAVFGRHTNHQGCFYHLTHGWDWRSWMLVSNCAFGVFVTGQQGLDIVVTLGHNLGKDLAGFVSGVGCQAYTKQQRWFQAVLPGVHVYQTCYQEDQSVVEVC
jgi:hypothetical protein